MSCPCQHLKWLEQNILQEKQWIEQLEGWSRASKNIAVKAPHKPPSHQMQKKRRFRPGTVALRERYIDTKSLQTYWLEGLHSNETHMRSCEGIRNDLRIQAAAIKGLQGSSRGLFGWSVWRLQPVCYPCKTSYHHAKRCTVS